MYQTQTLQASIPPEGTDTSCEQSTQCGGQGWLLSPSKMYRPSTGSMSVLVAIPLVGLVVTGPNARFRDASETGACSP